MTVRRGGRGKVEVEDDGNDWKEEGNRERGMKSGRREEVSILSTSAVNITVPHTDTSSLFDILLLWLL